MNLFERYGDTPTQARQKQRFMRRTVMHQMKTIALLAALAVSGSMLTTGSVSSVSAEAPPCVGSTSPGPHPYSCTDDFQATPGRSKSKQVKRKLKLKRKHKLYQIQRGNNRFKAKTIPCYQNPVPGCEG